MPFRWILLFSYQLQLFFKYFRFSVFYFIVKYKTGNQLYKDHQPILDNFFTIANAALVSGFVGAINQFLEYNKIYQNAIEQVLQSESYRQFIENNMVKFAYSRQILQHQSDLENIWRITTSTLFQTEFPDEIGRKFYDKIHKTIFYKKTISHYHFDCQISYSVSIDSNDQLKIEQYAEYTIVRNKVDKFTYDFSYGVLKETKNSIEIKSVTACGKDYNRPENIRDEEQEVNGQSYKFKKFQAELEGEEYYHITSGVLIHQNHKTDNEFSYLFERFTEDVHVEINNESSSQMDVIFSSSGVEAFKKIPIFGSVSSIKKYSYRGILLPGFGFTLFFIKK